MNLHPLSRIATLALAVAAAWSAEPTARETVLAAARRLADKPGYAWKTTVELGEAAAGNRWRPGPTEGRTQKEGFTCVSTSRGEVSIEFVTRGDKTAIKTPDGWQTPADIAAGTPTQGNPVRGISRMVENFKTPAAEIEALLDKAGELTLEGGIHRGDLTADGARTLLSFNRRPAAGSEGPAVNDARGSLRIWLKDGLVTRYAVQLQGSMTVNGSDLKLDRTTTTEIKDVGTARVEVPAEARAKLD